MLATTVSSASRASVLSSAAAALQPGRYAALSTGLTGNDLYPDLPDTGGSMLDWADSGAWDPVGHRFLYVGKKAGCSSTYRNIVYDETSNSWSYGPVPITSGCGHGYDGNTSDPVTGTFFFRPYSSLTIYKFTGSSWTSLPSLPSGANTCCTGIAKSPYGLLYSDFAYDVYYNDATGQRVVVNVGSTYPSYPPIGDYNTIAEYDPVHDVFLIGGGNGSRAMYKVTIVNGSPVRTRLGDAPFDFGTGEIPPHTNIQADPVTGEFIVYRKATGQFYGYNITTDTWRLLGTSGDGKMPPLPTGDGTSPIGAPVYNYGVIMYITHDFSNAAVYIYKHSAAGPADTVPPAAPSSLIAR
jgi:hypothetical protein